MFDEMVIITIHLFGQWILFYMRQHEKLGENFASKIFFNVFEKTTSPVLKWSIVTTSNVGENF